MCRVEPFTEMGTGRDGRAVGYMVLCPVEGSGQRCEPGVISEWMAHEAMRPDARRSPRRKEKQILSMTWGCLQ